MTDMNNEVMSMPAIPRTSAGLRNALFDELDGLRSNRTNATKANATAKLALAIISTVEMELEVHKTMNRLPKDRPDTVALPPLALGNV